MNAKLVEVSGEIILWSTEVDNFQQEDGYTQCILCRDTHMFAQDKDTVHQNATWNKENGPEANFGEEPKGNS